MKLHFEDFLKVKKVVASCETSEQLTTAKRYAKQYFKHPSTAQFLCGFKDNIIQKEKQLNETGNEQK